MATEAQRARRRAQRQVAKIVKENRGKPAGERKHILPPAVTKPSREVTRRYAEAVIAGLEVYPHHGTLEAKSLARLASYARWGKEDSRYEDYFMRYWYHEATPQEDIEE